MIILDLQQVMISTLMAQLGGHNDIEIQEDLLRHMVLNSIRAIKLKFSPEYGELVIACDHNNSWRKSVFPYYKANRKKAREESELDWNLIFNSLNQIKAELKEYFPYKVIHVEGAEADDVIGTLVLKQKYRGPVLIVSGDKDFIQLHSLGIRQYDNVKKAFIEHSDPTKYLAEHIIKGDRGDGIPNILSPDNCLVIGQRQRPMRQSRLEILSSTNWDTCADNELKRNYMRNRQLINLSCTPQVIVDQILTQYTEQGTKQRPPLINYFIKNKLKNLMPAIGEF